MSYSERWVSGYGSDVSQPSCCSCASPPPSAPRRRLTLTGVGNALCRALLLIAMLYITFDYAERLGFMRGWEAKPCRRGTPA